MAKCTVCGEEVLMPFKCSYCGEYFCASHRLPEKHGCPGLFAAASPYEKEKKRVMVEGVGEERWERLSWGHLKSRRSLMGGELLHLAIGALLVILIGFSLIGYRLSLPPWVLLSFIVGFAASFLFHELGHRAYARSYGLYARFKLDPLGALLTLLTAIPMMPFKIIAPGAVVIYGVASLEVLGMTALVGPLVNLAISAVLNVSAFVVGQLPGFAAQSYLQYLLYRLGALNAFIAFFNLIPLGGLDGRKVLAWSPIKWAISFAVSLVMVVLAFVI
ncbi:MAG: hypothetical protein NZ918_03710 [Aigarchaeota archaeon]|nr:hypothetical protein [Aigarchaeota archaeon]